MSVQLITVQPTPFQLVNVQQMSVELISKLSLLLQLFPVQEMPKLLITVQQMPVEPIHTLPMSVQLVFLCNKPP